MYSDQVADRLGPLMRRIGRLPAAERVAAADQVWLQLKAAEATLARLTRAAVRELRQDHTLQETAEMLGKSVTRVKQIQDGKDRQPRRKKDTT